MNTSPLPENDPFKNFDKIFLFVGLGILVVFNLIGWPIILLASAKSLTCERAEPSQKLCSLKTHRGPLAWEETIQTFPVSELLGADVERSDRSEGVYRVIVATERNEFPLMSAYTSGYEHKAAIADEINNFVNNPQETRLQVRQDGRWVSYLMGILFLLPGNLVGIPFIWVGLTSQQSD